MTPVTKAIIEVIGDAGFAVTIGHEDGLHVVEARALESGELFRVTGDDLDTTAVELAERVGIELEDG
jgi:hypothetical protein